MPALPRGDAGGIVGLLISPMSVHRLHDVHYFPILSKILKPMKKQPVEESKTFETRRAAFRAAKREHGIPMKTHPREVVKPYTEEAKRHKLDGRNRRLYIFEIIRSILGLFVVNIYHVREDKEALYADGGKQAEHFNAGDPEENEKLKKHYYFKRR